MLMIRPLDLQRCNIGRISEGLFDLPPINSDRTDEIGAIAASVEDLRVTLQSAAAAQHESAYKGAAFNAASAAMMMADLDYKIGDLAGLQVPGLSFRFVGQPKLFANGHDLVHLFRELTELGELIVGIDPLSVPDLDAIAPDTCAMTWLVKLDTQATDATLLGSF